ncbi:ATP-binding protein [Actinoallomurus soli]|uniref:ATP-binding protein n=1 Tax=Actinoallomurus soli TaxID=2952535 RepID=UPI00209390D8|nr:ATP-binding protein [Actinoallomurus soli]MCO5974905.1 ATP-binding protein [Actinoallomurus soli]
MAVLGERLRELRRRSFVGRDSEVSLFRTALAEPGLIFVHGAGGVGKSALLEVFGEVAEAAGRPVVRVDVRHLRLAPGAMPAVAGGDRPVLLIDTYELLADSDDWVREEYLPSLPGDVLVVIAGRQAPRAQWRADPAWRDLMRVVALDNLSPDDGRRYLTVQQVPPEWHGRLLAISHGHPLALSMLVDAVRRGAEPRTLADLPDVVSALLTQAVDAAPSPRHRAVLEICAHAPVTTEELLHEVIGADAGELFAWLRALPFVDEGPRGLYPHDIARDALDSDLRWRAPGRYADLQSRIAAAMLARIRASVDEREQIQLLVDTIVAASARSKIETCTAPPPTMQAYADRLRDGDRDPIIAMTSAWQGEQQAALAAYWMTRQPAAFWVFRSLSGEPRGYAACLELTGAELDEDPGAAAMWRYAHDNGAPRPGEQVRAWRFFLDRDHGQFSSPSVTLFAACQTLDILIRGDNSAWTLVGAYADAARWCHTLANLGFQPASGAEYAVGDRRFPVFAHDWRRVDVTEWLRFVRARQTGAPVQLTEPGKGKAVLSEPEFARAVRDALRDLHAPERIRDNPLLRSRVVRQHERGDRPSVDTLRDLFATGAGVLRPDLGALVDRTFLHPATTQERIAQQLHLSFNTYRRHRDRAVAHLTEWLWAREVGQRPDTE